MLEALLSSSEWAGTTYSHLIELWRPLIPVYKMPDTHHSSLFHTHTALPVPFWLTILKNSSMVSSLLLFKMKLLPGGRAECENQTYSPVENVSIEMATSCIYTCLFLIWCFGNYFASRSPLSINCWRLGRCIRREEEQINASVPFTLLWLFSNSFYWDIRCRKGLQYKGLLYFEGTASCSDGNTSLIPYWWS